MDAKTLLEGIKKLVFGDAEVTYKLIDGTEITVDTLMVGSAVTIAGAPATPNDYTLEDGTILKVGEDGKITEVIAPLSMESAKLKDGTVLEVSALEIGGTVMVNGQLAAAGDWELEDGRTITVGADGKIIEIGVKETEVLASVDDAVAKFSTGTPDERVQNLENFCRALMHKLAELKPAESQSTEQFDSAIAAQKAEIAILKADFANQKEINTQLVSLVEKLTEVAPEDAPKGKKKFSHVADPELKSEKLNRFAAAAQKIREEQEA